MDATLQKLFDKIENDRRTLFSELKNYSDETLNKKPSAEAWSVAEVLAHLIVVEEASLKYLNKKLLDTSKAQREGLAHKWRWFLVSAVFFFNIKFKAPKVVEPPLGHHTLAELDTQWSNTRLTLYALLDKLPEGEAHKDLWKHAIAGKLNLFKMVEFFGIHYGRHRKQIERTLNAVS